MFVVEILHVLVQHVFERNVTVETQFTFKGPSYSTDRVEEVIVPGDSHTTTTLDIKSIRKNKVPLPSSEDDRNLSVSDQQYVRVW